MSMKLTRLVKLALKEAVKSEHRYQHGAVIFRRGKVIGRGFNKTNRGTSRFKGYWRGSLHAEIAALLDIRGAVHGASIVIVRNNLRNSFPCASCLAALKEVGIKSIFYSNEGSIYAE